jgi:hypothetical protein
VSERDDFAAALRPLSRRSFLRLAGAAAAAGLLPTGCGGERAAWLRPPAGTVLNHLSERGYAVLAAATARMVGGTGAEWIAEGRIAPAATADAWLDATPDLAGPLGQGLLLLEFAVFPLLPKLRPFTALPATGQCGVLADLSGSEIGWKRELFKGVRSIAFLTFYSDPAVRPLIGHPGPFGRGPVRIADAMSYPVAP